MVDFSIKPQDQKLISAKDFCKVDAKPPLNIKFIEALQPKDFLQSGGKVNIFLIRKKFRISQKNFATIFDLDLTALREDEKSPHPILSAKGKCYAMIALFPEAMMDLAEFSLVKRMGVVL